MTDQMHAYIIGHYNPSVRIIDLVSHTTYVVCFNFIHKCRDLQFKVNKCYLEKYLGTPTIKDFQLYRFWYLRYLEGAMPPNDRSPIFVKKS